MKRNDASGKSAYEAEQAQAFAGGKQTMERIAQLATDNKPADFRAAIAALAPGKKADGKLPARFTLHLILCEHCYAGRFVSRLVVQQDNQITTSDLSQTELPAEFVRMVDPRFRLTHEQQH